MEENKKICPYCKTEIDDMSHAVECPACGMPHHEECWKENKGCTTFGCSYQNSVTEEGSMEKLTESGNVDNSEQQTAQNVSNVQRKCSYCGAPLAANQKFCSACGSKIDEVQNSVGADGNSQDLIDEYNAKNTSKKKTKKPVIIAVAIVAVVAVILIVIFCSGVLVSVEDLCSQGQYAEAYEKAEDSDKFDVLMESIAVYCSSLTPDQMVDSESFELEDAYVLLCYDDYDDDYLGECVLKVSGDNVLGNTVTNYWLYSVNDNGSWEFVGTCSTLIPSEQDDYEEYLVEMMCGLVVDDDDTSRQTGDVVNRINKWFESGTLDDVEIVDVNFDDVPGIPSC